MRLLICAGGTGGGVYPALAVHEALKLKVEKLHDAGSNLPPSTFKPFNLETLWVGGAGGMEEELVKRAGIPFQAIPAAGVHGVGLRALPGNLAKLAKGVSASRRILAEFKPDVLFFTGGYVAAPMALAGRKTPIVLYVPDIEPGLALKFLAHFADVSAVTADDSRSYFSRSNRIVVTGYPLRADLAAWSREKAFAHFGLSADKPVLLITGGSKGARSINQAVLKHLNELLESAQVIHVAGNLDWPTVQQKADSLPAELKKDYHALPYLHEMGAALAAANLVLSRAGASALGEYPRFGLPAVLVPYPYAWRYQKVNADYLVRRNAAVLLPDELLEDKLLAVLKELLANADKLNTMSAAMQSLSQPSAAEQIAGQLWQAAGEHSL
ncbi:MAG: UDP-N-acetylglucosamine--N-acetylmuramyl-(pentapeptide) pyrophosphoryl-undecaprenol N-acetylglucosamine transferase [Anaerolineales bacterium]|nr:UDP-N-acetylglucosamine--N-acetylmuramyl-(pentapeptide) pyrophosphoryl-undecaprenol N-acetylglucosamine transferase [Anaerolineales bacterium]